MAAQTATAPDGPTRAYHRYWAAWGDAKSLEDLYPYYGGPEFEETKKEVETDPAMADMAFLMLKGMKNEGRIERIEIFSREENAAELMVHWVPDAPPGTPGMRRPAVIAARMVKLDGRWFIGGEDVYGGPLTSTEVEVLAEPEVTQSTTPLPLRVQFKDLERVPVGEGSIFAISSKHFQPTEAVVTYYPEWETLHINLYADGAFFNCAIRSFPAKPGVYFAVRTLYVVHAFSENGIRCDIRTLDWGERPPDGISADEAAKLGKFRAYFTCDRVYMME